MIINPDTISFIVAEAERAHAKHGTNSMYHPAQSHERRYAILAEEVGEVARELNEAAIHGHLDAPKLCAELVQVAAMAMTWLEALYAGE